MLAVLRLAPTGLVGLIASVLPRKERDTLAKERSDIGRFLAAGASGQALAVRDLSVNFGGVRAVRDLTLEAQPGAITSIIGPNGAGKTTALNVICGFYRPDAGTVRLGDQIVSALRAHQIPRAGIARTYQTSQLFESMSVIDNVVIALRRGRLAPHFLTGGKHGDEAEIAESLLAFVGYRGALGRPADALAHVDKRLVEIARALAVRPSVLALDEPAAGLNAEDTAGIGALLRKLAAVGMTVILVEHDMDLVMGVSNHVIVLDAGAMIAEGTPAQVVADPAVLEAYLGAGEQAERGRKQPVAIAAQKPLMTVSALSAGYGAATVVRRADFEIAEGELVAVLGANGAGKTTLMRALSGLLRPIEGEVRFLGERIDHFPGDRIARAGLVLVPEGRQVFPELSVTDNLRLGAYARRSAEEASMIENLLTRFPALKARQYQRAGLLSGGEQQMLAIARGLMARPQVLMLDEPSLGLAPKLLENLYDLLAALRDEGITILLVDQMAQLALSVADRAYVLQSGAFTHSGTAREVTQDPALVKAYLGGHGALL
jgi:ABC-type branched-subunit amino acid transport system ATPase component